MNGFVRLAAATAALLVVCILGGIAGLAVGELIPDRLVAEALHDARVDGSLTPTTQEPTRLGGVADHITECGEISFGLGEPADAGFLETLAEGTILGGCDQLISRARFVRSQRSTSAGRRRISATGTGHRWSSGRFSRLLGLPALRLLSFAALVAATLSLGRRVELARWARPPRRRSWPRSSSRPTTPNSPTSPTMRSPWRSPSPVPS